MAVLTTGTQYKYTGKGPFDVKSLVSTYDKLLLEDTWGGYAYNGMVVGVGLNTADLTKNGIYYLYDSTVKNALGIPDVKNEANWHKLGTLAEIDAIAERVTSLETNGSIDENTVNSLIQNQIDALKAEIESAGYLTSDALEPYAKTETVYTKTEIDNKGFATQTYVTTKIAEAQLAGEDVDLSGYATKDDLNNYAKIADIEANYATKAESNKNLITADKIIEVDTIFDLPNVGDGNYFYVAKDTGYTYIYDSKEVSYKKFAINENYTVKKIDGGDASSVYGA